MCAALSDSSWFFDLCPARWYPFLVLWQYQPHGKHRTRSSLFFIISEPLATANARHVVAPSPSSNATKVDFRERFVQEWRALQRHVQKSKGGLRTTTTTTPFHQSMCGRADSYNPRSFHRNNGLLSSVNNNNTAQAQPACLCSITEGPFTTLDTGTSGLSKGRKKRGEKEKPLSGAK